MRNDKAVLIRIARNLVYDHYRRKRLLKWLPIEQERPDERPLPPEIVERSEEVRRLYRALSEIRLNYREAIVLRYIEEMSVKEVAGHLQMTEVQVKNNTVRGLKALRKILGVRQMIEERLKELSLTPDKQKKTLHFQQIERRLQRSRQRTKWQVGLILALVCTLVVFFIGTGEVNRLQSSADTNITRAYITLGKAIHTRRYRIM